MSSLESEPATQAREANPSHPPEARWLTSHNPATGAELSRVAVTDPAEVAVIVARAVAAQQVWAAMPIGERLAAIRRWWGILSRDAQGWADAIRDEVGKPPGEAMAEVVTALDGVRWTVKNARRALQGESVGRGWQIMMLIPRARLRWAPLGVVGMIGTWNYPLLLNAPAMAQALAAGNALVWKPSELAVGLGERLQRSVEEAGLPPGLVRAVHGNGDVGRALLEAPGLAKVLFTGGVENGRRVLGTLGALGIPAVVELAGFDAAVVLPDAPLDATVRALTWAAFIGAGQTCVAIKRVIVVGDPAPWAEAMAAAAARLRVGDPAGGDVDVGPMIHRDARDKFEATIAAAEATGAKRMAGGRALAGPGSFFAPTVLVATDPARVDAIQATLAGCFGPVVLIRGVEDDEAAIAAANSSGFGLAASVWGRDRGRAARVAERLEVGSVAINDAVTPSAHAAAPFGGCKASGFGRVRGVLGLRELAQPQVIHTRRPGGFRPHLFPSSPRLLKIMRTYRWIWHRPG